MSTLLFIPSEIHLAIFKDLTDPHDILNFSSTCRSLRSLLKSNTRTLLRTAASKYFPAFDDCLRAARASKLPIEWEGNHFDLGENRYLNPPTKAFCEGLASAPPTFDELLTVREISRLLGSWLARFAQLVYMDSFTEHGEESFYRAGARFLVMSYLFSGSFLEPLRGRKRPDQSTDEDGVKRFPTYHTADPDWRYTQLESLYGGFIDWIIEEGEKQGPGKSWTASPEDPNFNPFRKILRSLFGIGPELKASKGYRGFSGVASLLLMLELSQFGASEVPHINIDEKTVLRHNIRLCHFGEFRPKFEVYGDRSRSDPPMCFLIGFGYPTEESLTPISILQDIFGPRQSPDGARGFYRPYMDFFRIALKNRNIAFYHEQRNHYSRDSNFYLYDRGAEA